MSHSDSKFKEIVIAKIKEVPHGKVSTYGAIATLAGSPRSARQVGWVLSSLAIGSDIPWWRIVNRYGYLSIRNEDMSAKVEQKIRLEEEGIEVSDDFVVNLQKYLFIGSPG